MALLQNIWEALSTNWVNWIFTTIVTLLGAYVGIRYQARRQASIDEKEKEQAKSEIINLMENRLVNEKGISQRWISNIISASEKRNDIKSLSQVSPITLLQELMFDIEESSHLDPGQKESYVGTIQEAIEDFENSKRIDQMSDSYSGLIEDLRKEIEDGNETALKVLQRLENKVVEEPPEKTTKSGSPPIERTISAVMGAIVSAILAYTLLKIFSTLELGIFSPVLNGFATMFATLGTILLIIITILIISENHHKR